MAAKKRKKHEIPLSRPNATSVVRQRKAQIRKLLKLGKGDSDIQEACAAEWHITTRQVRKYLFVIREEWQRLERDRSVDHERADLRQQIDDSLFDARMAKDRHAVAALLRLKAQTFLPQQRQQLDITSKGERIAMTHEEALAEIAAVLRIQERAERELNVIDMEEVPALPIPIKGAK